MQKCLIMTRQEPQPELPAEPKVVTTLRKACKKLQTRKQKRPRQILDGVTEWHSLG